MPVAQPPYAIAPLPFRFGALAALAGRAPLGGKREIAMALYMAARLAQDALPERELSETARGERANSAKQWLATLAIPASIRPTIVALIESSASEPQAVCRSMRATLGAVGEILDKDARAELLVLAAALDRQ